MRPARARAAEAVAWIPVARAHLGSAELHGALRRALRRHRGRAGALPRGATLTTLLGGGGIEYNDIERGARETSCSSRSATSVAVVLNDCAASTLSRSRDSPSRRLGEDGSENVGEGEGGVGGMTVSRHARCVASVSPSAAARDSRSSSVASAVSAPGGGSAHSLLGDAVGENVGEGDRGVSGRLRSPSHESRLRNRPFRSPCSIVVGGIHAECSVDVKEYGLCSSRVPKAKALGVASFRERLPKVARSLMDELSDPMGEVAPENPLWLAIARAVRLCWRPCLRPRDLEARGEGVDSPNIR